MSVDSPEPPTSIPGFRYEGVQAWDVSAGASLSESSRLLTASEQRGYSLTVYQVRFEIEPEAVAVSESREFTLVLMAPAAP